MMREIRYRAWYEERKKMYEVAKIDLWGDPDRATCDLASDDEQLFDIYLHEVVLMQYTGLKDKNGKEIYEGDICHIGDPNIKYKIAWYDTGLMGKAITASDYIGLNYWNDKTEVIGNIYEDVEPLQGE